MGLASAFRLNRVTRRPVHAGAGVVALALAVTGLAACRPQEGSGILVWRGRPADPRRSRSQIRCAAPTAGRTTRRSRRRGRFGDSYRRVTWRELEPTQGNYDFSRLDEGIATGTRPRRGVRLSGASPCTGCAAGGVAVPDYLRDLMPKGFWFRLNNTTNYAPDWNDPDYLSRLDALLTCWVNDTETILASASSTSRHTVTTASGTSTSGRIRPQPARRRSPLRTRRRSST